MRKRKNDRMRIKNEKTQQKKKNNGNHSFRKQSHKTLPYKDFFSYIPFEQARA